MLWSKYHVLFCDRTIPKTMIKNPFWVLRHWSIPNWTPHCSIYKQHWLHLMIICIHRLSIDIIYHSKFSSGLLLRCIVLSSKCYQTNSAILTQQTLSTVFPLSEAVPTLQVHMSLWRQKTHCYLNKYFLFHFSSLKALPKSIQTH